MRSGVGYSDNMKSLDAGAEATRAALSQADSETADLVMVFCSPGHDPVALRDGIRSIVGADTRLIGGHSMGIITSDVLDYDVNHVGLATLCADSGSEIDLFIEGRLPDNEFNVGLALGKQIRGKEYKGDPNIVLLYDSVRERSAEGFACNFATPLLEGLEQGLGAWPPTAGVGIMGGMEGEPTYQWFDDRIEQGSAMALVLSGDVRMDTVVLHGCKPASGYHTVTKAEGPVLLEIDGKSAVDMVADILGPDADQSWEDYPLFVTLGVNKGQKFGPFNEEDYANHLCQAVDKERGGLVMFENDLRAGVEVQLMRRSIDFNYIEPRVNQLYERIGNRDPFFALYIDCAGRASTYCGTDGEEATEVQRTVGSRMPLLGMYSGVEIAKVGGVVQALDWTGVLCVFSR